MLPFTSLDAATAAGPGEAKDLEGALAIHFLIAVVTGGPSTADIALEGSHDGVTWVTLATASGTVASRTARAEAYAVRYVRANLTSLSGGSAPTVTATIASA
ncbi:hypothetical protein ACFWQ6_00765 [Streptomyces coelicoflavus]|uniref:hypothetical protein n=1 Tax=Streptomyces coelicoflavus TaxID=285562 RepID=UPI00365067A7